MYGETTQYDILMVDTCQLSKPKKCATRSVNLNVNHRLWMRMMYQSVGSLMIITVSLWCGMSLVGIREPKVTARLRTFSSIFL